MFGTVTSLLTHSAPKGHSTELSGACLLTNDEVLLHPVTPDHGGKDGFAPDVRAEDVRVRGDHVTRGRPKEIAALNPPNSAQFLIGEDPIHVALGPILLKAALGARLRSPALRVTM